MTQGAGAPFGLGTPTAGDFAQLDDETADWLQAHCRYEELDGDVTPVPFARDFNALVNKAILDANAVPKGGVTVIETKRKPRLVGWIAIEAVEGIAAAGIDRLDRVHRNPEVIGGGQPDARLPVVNRQNWVVNGDGREVLMLDALCRMPYALCPMPHAPHRLTATPRAPRRRAS